MSQSMTGSQSSLGAARDFGYAVRAMLASRSLRVSGCRPGIVGGTFILDAGKSRVPARVLF
jgi:hypothetical protein